MYCISINHKNTPANIRNQFAFDQDSASSFLSRAKRHTAGCVLLSTCNRCEVYFTGEASVYEKMEQLLSDFKKIDVQQVRRYSMNYGEDTSIKHLCKVVCGMDSMVLGEVEIIRQVKEAYLRSQKEGLADGEVNIIFQGALNTAKTMAADSDITRLPVSVGTLCAKEAVRFCSQIEDRPGRVLVVGVSGKTGGVVARDICDMSRDIEVRGTVRRHCTGSSAKKEMESEGRQANCTVGRYSAGDSEKKDVESERCPENCTKGRYSAGDSAKKEMESEVCPAKYKKIELYDYRDRYQLAGWADVIISATSSPHYIFLKDELCGNLNNDNRQKLFIDLAMPRDIDPEIGNIPGCQLKDIDYFNVLAKENNQAKEKTLNQLRPFISEHAVGIRNEVELSRFNRENRELMEKLRASGQAGVIYSLKGTLDTESFLKVLAGIK
jgi:glutamyl-tRNA reductase